LKFITDHDIYFLTVKELRQEGYDVVTAREINMHIATDEELLNKIYCCRNGFTTAIFKKYSPLEIGIKGIDNYYPLFAICYPRFATRSPKSHLDEKRKARGDRRTCSGAIYRTIIYKYFK